MRTTRGTTIAAPTIDDPYRFPPSLGHRHGRVSIANILKIFRSPHTRSIRKSTNNPFKVPRNLGTGLARARLPQAVTGAARSTRTRILHLHGQRVLGGLLVTSRMASRIEDLSTWLVTRDRTRPLVTDKRSVFRSLCRTLATTSNSSKLVPPPPAVTARCSLLTMTKILFVLKTIVCQPLMRPLTSTDGKSKENLEASALRRRRCSANCRAHQPPRANIRVGKKLPRVELLRGSVRHSLIHAPAPTSLAPIRDAPAFDGQVLCRPVPVRLLYTRPSPRSTMRKSILPFSQAFNRHDPGVRL